jgi:RimJ/RimL family protein N-acetyltransferase
MLAELVTGIEGLSLRKLTVADADRYLDLLDRNRDHLTAFGDFTEVLTLTKEDVRLELGADEAGRFGILLRGTLIGRVDLQQKGSGDAVLGFWLDQAYVGHGYATASCRAVIGAGRASIGMRDVWAGVSHGNESSEALLRRLGFEPVADMGSYTRFHLDVRGGDGS